MQNLISAARRYAGLRHEAVNHRYDNYLPYEFHLRLVEVFAKKYIELIPEDDREIVLSACWLHDVLEDTHTTYNDLMSYFSKQYFGEEFGMRYNPQKLQNMADIVYAVTNEKGRNRKERANEKYYQGIGQTQYAMFVKLCDRLANVFYSRMFKSPKLAMYHKESNDFVANLQKYDEFGNYDTLQPMVTEIWNLFREEII